MNYLFVTSLEAIAVIPYLSQSHVFTENSSQLLFHSLSYSSRFSHWRLTSIHNIENPGIRTFITSMPPILRSFWINEK
jgi:hypothetical protein